LARWAKTEEDALEALVRYVPRYRASMGAAAKALKEPRAAKDMDVTERLKGNATTDFGAPGIISAGDRRELTSSELDRALAQLYAAWKAFQRTADKNRGARLAPSGPRGGGRSLAKMVAHVREAEEGYTSAVGGKSKPAGAEWSVVQEAFVAAIRARNAGELPDVGPRGGERWPALFAMRRSAWHALDHAWELEDRAQATVGTRR
jgi:hypothetical protein